MAILHVCPNNDEKVHVLNVEADCWCTPNVQDEGLNAKGFPCKTVIHKPIRPVMEGHDLQIHKVWLAAESGAVMATQAGQTQRHGAIKVAVR